MKYGKLSLVVFLLFIFLSDLWYFTFFHIKLSRPFTLSIKAGDTLKTVALKLGDHHILQRTNYFVLLGRLLSKDKLIKTGDYQIETNTNIYNILTRIFSGNSNINKFIIIEGTTYSDVQSILDKTHKIKKSHQVINPEIFPLLKESPIINLEGVLFPDTYFYTAETRDEQLIIMAYKKMEKILNESWEVRANNLPYKNKYEALIMASIIEKETSKDLEKPIVAGVFTKRLLKNMPLQADSTIKYSLGRSYRGKVLHEHLRYKSPYNSYINKGLPPTPICYPSKNSILAAMNPENSEYYYFVKNGFEGHTFSKNLKEHNNAIENLKKIIKCRRDLVKNITTIFEIKTLEKQ